MTHLNRPRLLNAFFDGLQTLQEGLRQVRSLRLGKREGLVGDLLDGSGHARRIACGVQPVKEPSGHAENLGSRLHKGKPTGARPTTNSRAIEQVDDFLGRAGFAQARKYPGDAIVVRLGAPVGHGVEGEGDVEAQFIGMAGG